MIERYGQDRHRFREEQHTRLCAEATQPSTPVDVRQYHDTIDGREVEMHVLREDPFIVYLKNWTIGDECADMEAQATRIGLSAAQVFGEQSVIADRRAISANLNWNNRNASSVNNRLIERAFAFAAKQRGYAIQPGPFQEPLNFIQSARRRGEIPRRRVAATPRPARGDSAETGSRRRRGWHVERFRGDGVAATPRVARRDSVVEMGSQRRRGCDVPGSGERGPRGR